MNVSLPLELPSLPSISRSWQLKTNYTSRLHLHMPSLYVSTICHAWPSHIGHARYCNLRRKPPTFLSVLIFSSVSRFAFSSKRKSVQKLCLDFFVSVQIAVTTTRKSRHTYYTNLCFKENANFDTL